MELRDEEQVASHADLLGAASVDDELVGGEITQIDDLPRYGDEGEIAPGVDIPEDEEVGGGVEDVQLAAQVVEGGSPGVVTHHREVPERRAGVLDEDPVPLGGHPVAGLGLVEDVAGPMPGDDPPASGDLDVGGESAHGQAAHQRVRVVGDVDDGEGVAEGGGDVERPAVGGQGQIARVVVLEVRGAGGDLRDLGEGRAGIDAEGAHFVLEAVSGVEPRTGGVEDHFFSVEIGREFPDDLVGTRVDDAGEVSVHVLHYRERAREDRRVVCDGDSGRPGPQPVARGTQVDPARHHPRARVHDRDAKVRVTFAAGERHIDLPAVGRDGHLIGPAPHRLVAEGPELVPSHVVGIDAVAGIRPAGEVVHLEEDLREALQAGPLAGGRRAHDLLDRIRVRPGDDLVA